MLQRLREKIGNSGKIFENYGGYDIIILDYEKFPWKDVFEMLIDCGFQIWIKQKNSRLTIITKPEVG